MKIAVLLSGGVDSSVALRLLKDEGHNVTAFYLKIWLQDEFSFLGECPWEEDLKYTRRVCEQAKVPLEVIPLQTEYWDNVVSYTIEEIKEGRTPNPDIFCNSLIKFGEFYDKIDKSFEKVASGHYAKVEMVNGKHFLKTSPDPIKDQTYFLAYLTQQQLSRAFDSWLKNIIYQLWQEETAREFAFLGKLNLMSLLNIIWVKLKAILLILIIIKCWGNIQVTITIR